MMRFAGQLLTAPQPIQDTVTLLPGGEQGPAQGPNIPIKNYGGRYMPDAAQPTGYRPGPQGCLIFGNKKDPNGSFGVQSFVVNGSIPAGTTFS